MRDGRVFVCNNVDEYNEFIKNELNEFKLSTVAFFHTVVQKVVFGSSEHGRNSL